jgi:hypothetical protein
MSCFDPSTILLFAKALNLPHHMEVVAGGGIGRQMPVFRKRATIFAELFRYNPSRFGLTQVDSLTEDFALAPAAEPSRSSALSPCQNADGELVGGFADDHADVREWCSLFQAHSRRGGRGITTENTQPKTLAKSGWRNYK